MNYIKIFRGRLKTGMTVYNSNTGVEERIGQIFTLKGKKAELVTELRRLIPSRFCAALPAITGITLPVAIPRRIPCTVSSFESLPSSKYLSLPVMSDGKMTGYVNAIQERAYKFSTQGPQEIAVPDNLKGYMQEMQASLMETAAEARRQCLRSLRSSCPYR